VSSARRGRAPFRWTVSSPSSPTSSRPRRHRDIGYDVSAAGFAAKTAAYQSACSKYLNGLANASNDNNCAILMDDSQTEERDMIHNVARLVVDLYHDLASG